MNTYLVKTTTGKEIIVHADNSTDAGNEARMKLGVEMYGNWYRLKHSQILSITKV